MNAQVNAFALPAVLDAMPNAIFIKNEALRFVFINRAYETMFGVRREDVVGRNVLDLGYLPEADRRFYQREDEEMLRRGETMHHVFTYTFADGQPHTCLYWSGGLTQEDGTRGLIGVIVDIAQQEKTIDSLQQELQCVISAKNRAEEKSSTDALTGVHNRGALDEAVARLVAAGGVFSCVMIDIDRFKSVNDRFGHPAGDAALKEIARIFVECTRESDTVGRYGGEEFVLLLPGIALDEALRVAERIRRRVVQTVALPDGENLTVSAGCCEYAPGVDAAGLLRRVDAALYEAKNSGRNRVRAWRGA
jgi:diguanylate cyclase (GGDEF)-like protein/PAS domain S-box-containing protein